MSKSLIFLIIISISLSGYNYSAFASNNKDNYIVTYSDKNKDGQADRISIKKNGFELFLALKNSQVHTIEFERSNQNLTFQTRYNRINSNFKIGYAYATTKKVFNGSTPTELSACNRWNGSRIADLSEIAQHTSPKETCYGSGNIPSNLNNAMSEIIAQSEETSACFSPISIKAEDYWFNIEEQSKKFEYCMVDDNSSSSCEGAFLKDKSQIKISKSCFSNNQNLKKILEHELKHAVTILDESIVDCATISCPNPEQLKKCAENNKRLFDKDHSGEYATFPVDSADGLHTVAAIKTPEASNQVNANKTISVPATIAAGSVPQPAPADLKIAAGATRTFSVASNSQSFPAQMVRFAETAMMPNTAVASTSSAKVSNNSKSNSANTTIRPIAASGQSRSIASTSAAAPAIKKSNLNLDSDSSNTKPAGALSKSSSEGSGSIETSQTGRNSGAVGPTSVVKSGTGSSAAGGKGSQAGNRPSRSVASVGDAAYSEDQIVNIFKKDSYSEVKKRLQQDRQFVEALRANNITIYNTKGDRIGSPSGKVIFSDTGNRFIQGK